jgi:shikimate dehydrogenase
MRLALIGKSISHSASPALYQKLLGADITYELLDVPSEAELPSLAELAQTYDGINITSPYKRFYFHESLVRDDVVRSLGALNTLSFSGNGTLATNTDVIAVRKILKNFQQKYSNLSIILLGSGVMAKVTQLVCGELGLSLQTFSRSQRPHLDTLDLCSLRTGGEQMLVINSCSREFVFKGACSGEEIFWDYNYDFIPHQTTLPLRVKDYQDGREMLTLQAQAAVDFWLRNKD